MKGCARIELTNQRANMGKYLKRILFWSVAKQVRQIHPPPVEVLTSPETTRSQLTHEYQPGFRVQKKSFRNEACAACTAKFSLLNVARIAACDL